MISIEEINEERRLFEDWLIRTMSSKKYLNHVESLEMCGDRYESLAVELAWQAWIEAKLSVGSRILESELQGVFT